MSSPILLRGITWNHSRGFLPMVATAQRFSEIHPDIQILWERRSLQEFADYPLEDLVRKFDLLVIDHPFVGQAARDRVLAPLDEALSASFANEQAQDWVGESHSSYFYEGHQWALAIDAAAPVSAWREDLLGQEHIQLPERWEELVTLARRGRVAFPSIPVDSLMNFYMLCFVTGEGPFPLPDTFVNCAAGSEALAMLGALVKLCPPEILTWNPIATYEAMASRDDIVYCPFAYGYSNYARTGYAPYVLQFGDVRPIRGSKPPRTTLGGTGLAISSACLSREAASKYVEYVASAECQKTLYFQSGGQPGRLSAWHDEEANRLTNNFFRNTLPALQRAYLRPRYPGYIEFQDRASLAVHEFLCMGGDARKVMHDLEGLFERSRAT